MLYRVDYTTRNTASIGFRYVNFAADKVEAVKRFMYWFFCKNPDDAVRIEFISEIEFVGDLSAMQFIDDAISEKTEGVE